jgi:hypothetical protein
MNIGIYLLFLTLIFNNLFIFCSSFALIKHFELTSNGITEGFKCFILSVGRVLLLALLGSH